MKSPILLPEDILREQAFDRDRGRCVLCLAKATRLNYLIDRRLFDDGGRYLDNTASMCREHYLESTSTKIAVEAIRKAANITQVILPDHLSHEDRFDKWGNGVLPNGNRLRGEMFLNRHVQKLLSYADVLKLFSWKVKYPRTKHLPWSLGISSDDGVLLSIAHFLGLEVVVTEKMDGENTTIYRDGLHARSIDGRSHISRSWVKQYAAGFAYELPEGWRICGENVYAKHSIGYSNLPSYFLGFSLWDETNTCLSWDETKAYFDMLGIHPVRELWRGIFDEQAIKSLWDANRDGDRIEGYVVRLAGSFNYRDFRKAVAKFVRAGHVQTDEHWMNMAVTPNGLSI